MNFDFSADQRLIQSEAKRFLEARCPASGVRAAMEKNSRYDAALWHEIIELGWLGIAIDECYGGLGLSYLELCLVAQELGRVAAPVPFASTVYLFAELVKLTGSDEQKQRWLPAVVKGEVIGALVTGSIGGNPNSVASDLRVEQGKLYGSHTAVIDGDIANVAVVAASDSEQAGVNSLFLVELNQQEISVSAQTAIDPSRAIASLVFSGATVERLGEPARSSETLQQLYDIAAVLIAFEQVGGAQAALAMGLAYTQQRYAFGRQIASFQAIKHKFADMYVANDLAEANAYYAAYALNGDQQALPLAAATARVSAGRAFFHSTKENIQVHGGMGYTWEFDCHLYYRRAQLLSSWLAGERYWRARLATALIETDREHLALL